MNTIIIFIISDIARGQILGADTPLNLFTLLVQFDYFNGKTSFNSTSFHHI